MSFCSNCGKVINQNAKFCGSCGAAIPQSSSQIFDDSITSNRVSPDTLSEIAKTVFVVPSKILGPLKSLLQRLGGSALDVVSGDDPQQLQELAVKRIRTASQSGRLGNVCIIGDWNDVPPFRIDNPIGYRDGDEHCMSDAVYGLLGINHSTDELDAISYVPDVSVGRIPLADIGVFQRVLFSESSSSDPIEAFQFAVTAECWKEATESIVERFTYKIGQIKLSDNPWSMSDRKSNVLNSPEWDDGALENDLIDAPLQDGSLILFNVHGSGDVTTWYGERHGGDTPEIFHPGTIASFKNSVLVSEACYGGALGYEEPSVTEHFFTNGGRAFVGCSVIAYGTPDNTLCGADLIALHFIEGLKSGMSFGQALNYAKFEVGVASPECDDVSLKTVISFNLFGIPWQKFSAGKKLKPLDTVDRLSDQVNIRDRVRNRMDFLRSKVDDSLSVRREDYRARLPDKLRCTIIERENFLRSLSEFRDYGKIETAIANFNSSIEACNFEQVTSDQFTGFRISGESPLPFGGVQNFLIVTDADGCLKKTIVSKGKSK